MNFIYISYFCVFLFLILYFYESNLYSRFLIFVLHIWYQFWTFKNPIFSTHFYSGVCWLLSPTFDSLVFYLRTPLFPPFPFSSQSNSVNLCGCLGYGDHSGNRQLRRFLSLLLTPPFSPPTHLYLPPPSPILHLTLWTSLGVPHGGESFHH